MGVNYWLYGDEVAKNSYAIDKEQVVQLSLMDQKQLVWTKAKVMIFSSPRKDAEAVALLGPFSQPYDEGKYHIKVVEKVPPDDLEGG